MKIQLASDLHLEFGHNVHIANMHDADVLVLAGDICMANAFKKKERHLHNVGYYHFFQEVSSRFNNVIYVIGNHEHYKNEFNKTVAYLKDALSEFPNIHILDNEYVDIDGVRFVGSTLWTDMNKGCPNTENYLRMAMSDFRIITYMDHEGNYYKFSPRTAMREHMVSRHFIEETVRDSNLPVVVVTHHTPSKRSIHPRYADEYFMNAGYHNDLEDIMCSKIKLWCHGHTHDSFDYTINDTRVVCNPFGYPNEKPLSEINPLFTVEI